MMRNSTDSLMTYSFTEDHNNDHGNYHGYTGNTVTQHV